MPYTDPTTAERGTFEQFGDNCSARDCMGFRAVSIALANEIKSDGRPTDEIVLPSTDGCRGGIAR